MAIAAGGTTRAGWNNADELEAADDNEDVDAASTSTPAVDNGVVYVAMPAFVNTSRAITLWGATGRLRGWRINLNAGKYYWRQQ